VCGIAGIVYDSRGADGPDWVGLRASLEGVSDASTTPEAPPDDLLDNLEAAIVGLRELGAMESLWQNGSLVDLLARGARDLADWESRSRAAVLDPTRPTPTNLLERWNSLWVRCRDLAWTLERDVLGCLDRVRALLPESLAQDERARYEAWKMAAVLENIGRMEVRGRDSLGISALVAFQDADAYRRFLERLGQDGLEPEWSERSSGRDLLNRAIRVDEVSDRPSLQFSYKVAEEVGALGDNVHALRQELRADGLMWAAFTAPGTTTNTWSHTRWASNGIISQANCHPVDEETPNDPASCPNGPWITAALNGDVDNYQELVAHLERETGRRISPRITTDAKIIPVMVDHYRRQMGDLGAAFRRAVAEFEGSTAIVMHSSLEPDRVYLALRGSGQSMFVGLCQGGYTFASELYGVVEQTSRFLRMDGTTERVPGQPETAGQILILDRKASGGLEGIEAWSVDGHRLVLHESDVRVAEITTRDINRGQHEHFLLKEIFDAPESVAKTLQGKFILPAQGQDDEVTVNLGPEVFPTPLVEKVKARKIRRVLLIGQGTAAVAGAAVCSMMERSLSGAGIEIRAVKATELSGYAMEQDMSETLVLAVSQSGTTTDTNRTVDLVRSRGATVIGIVNRRNSDLVYKVDGVLYTSDGRDIEMSVASTKAFYSQVVAGYLIGLRLALLLGTLSHREIRRELQELERLPQKMTSILETRGQIRELAERFATTRRDWAVVGSGCTRAAADEIRIKLSELCYKSIATDYIEDKKHIDLSSEPLTLVCAAGLSLMALRDAVKEVAIFKSHKSIPIVICTEGFDAFEPYAAGVVYVPRASENASVLLNTVVGHLWGYYCALAIDQGAVRLRSARALAVRHLASEAGLALTPSTLKQLLTIGRAFQDDLKNGRMNSSLSVDSGVALSLLFQYFTGAQPLRQLTQDFQKEATRDSLADTMVTCLSRAIQELSRPIDAIKHQAKTITVGISRSDEAVEGVLFQALQELEVAPEAVPYRDLALMRAMAPALESVAGATVYEVEGLGALGDVGPEARIRVLRKTGIAANLRSRADLGHPLVGTKQRVVSTRTTYVGRGRNDNRPLMMVPVLPSGQVEHLVLLHLRFVEDLPAEAKLQLLRDLSNRYEDLKSLVEEANLIWRDDFVKSLKVEDLVTLPVDDLAERVLNLSALRA